MFLQDTCTTTQRTREALYKIGRKEAEKEAGRKRGKNERGEGGRRKKGRKEKYKER